MACRACRRDHSPLLRCEVAARQREAMDNAKVDNAAWITPVVVESRTYRYRDPVRRRAQMAEVMKRYRARKRAGLR